MGLGEQTVIAVGCPIDAQLNTASGGLLQTGTTVTVYRINLAEVDYTGGHTVHRDVAPQDANAPRMFFPKPPALIKPLRPSAPPTGPAWARS